MFVIVHNDRVIYGPRNWSKIHFEQVILDDCEFECSLDLRKSDFLPVIVSHDIKILPIERLPLPVHNSKIQILQGPYWNMFDDKAEMYYEVMNMPIEPVKNILKDAIMNVRYNYEVKGFKHIVQGTEVTINTSRTSRDVFLNTYLSMTDNESVSWKFSEGWVNVSKFDLQQIVNEIKRHVQDGFSWEQSKSAEIDSANTLEELDAIQTEIFK
jgi:hypothetical protein